MSRYNTAPEYRSLPSICYYSSQNVRKSDEQDNLDVGIINIPKTAERLSDQPFHTIHFVEFDDTAASNEESLFISGTANCPGGICTNQKIKNLVDVFLKSNRVKICHLKRFNDSYFCVKDRIEGCTYIAVHVTNSKKTEIVIWELNFTTTDGKHWSFLGNGAFNIAYKSADCDINAMHMVYKIPLSHPLGELPSHQSPTRSVRLWNQINEQFPARLYGAGWITPYIPTRLSIHNSNHLDALSRWLVDLYNTERRILIDAFPQDDQGNILNFRVYETNNQSRIVCIDTDLALDLNPDPANASEDSFQFWADNVNIYEYYLKKNCHKQIEQTILALIVANQYFPDIILDSSSSDLNFILNSLCRAFLDKKIEIFRQNQFLFLPEEELSKKDERGKKLCHEYGLQGQKFREIYADRANFTLNKLNLLISLADKINMPRHFLRYLFEGNSSLKFLSEKSVESAFFGLIRNALVFMQPDEKLIALQYIHIGTREIHLKQHDSDRNELFSSFIAELPRKLFDLWIRQLAQLQQKFKMELEEKKQEAVLQVMTPRNEQHQDSDKSTLSTDSNKPERAKETSATKQESSKPSISLFENRFYGANQMQNHPPIIKPKEKETSCCGFF